MISEIAMSQLQSQIWLTKPFLFCCLNNEKTLLGGRPKPESDFQKSAVFKQNSRIFVKPWIFVKTTDFVTIADFRKNVDFGKDRRFRQNPSKPQFLPNISISVWASKTTSNMWDERPLAWEVNPYICDCDDMRHGNVNSTIETPRTYICNCNCDVAIAIAIDVCIRVLKAYPQTNAYAFSYNVFFHTSISFLFLLLMLMI